MLDPVFCQPDSVDIRDLTQATINITQDYSWGDITDPAKISMRRVSSLTVAFA